MQKQFKVIKINNPWSLEKLRKKLEESLNKFSREGWEVINISFLHNSTYTVMITISK